MLEPNTTDWRTSYFDLPIWTIPFNITVGIPHGVSIFLAPTDVISYGIAVTPDRARALVLMRVQHRTYPTSRGVFIFDDDTANVTCYMKWSGYTYHVASVNLQSGSREQDYVVGVQNQSCRATFYNATTGVDSGSACFSACSPGSSPTSMATKTATFRARPAYSSGGANHGKTLSSGRRGGAFWAAVGVAVGALDQLSRTSRCPGRANATRGRLVGRRSREGGRTVSRPAPLPTPGPRLAQATPATAIAPTAGIRSHCSIPQ